MIIRKCIFTNIWLHVKDMSQVGCYGVYAHSMHSTPAASYLFMYLYIYLLNEFSLLRIVISRPETRGGGARVQVHPLSSERGCNDEFAPPPQSHIKETVSHNFLKSSLQ